MSIVRKCIRRTLSGPHTIFLQGLLLSTQCCEIQPPPYLRVWTSPTPTLEHGLLTSAQTLKRFFLASPTSSCYMYRCHRLICDWITGSRKYNLVVTCLPPSPPALVPHKAVSSQCTCSPRTPRTVVYNSQWFLPKSTTPLNIPLWPPRYPIVYTLHYIHVVHILYILFSLPCTCTCLWCNFFFALIHPFIDRTFFYIVVV